MASSTNYGLTPDSFVVKFNKDESYFDAAKVKFDDSTIYLTGLGDTEDKMEINDRFANEKSAIFRIYFSTNQSSIISTNQKAARDLKIF